MEKLAVSVEEAASAVALSKFTIIAYLRRGVLKGTRCGRRWIVPVAELERLVRSGAPPLGGASK